jgi:Predicted pyridoxal phosphate-dependent enzyme apparently involved in regulation of cell wall biogenesis
MIPYVDLKAQYQSIKSEIDTAVLGVLGSGQFVLGAEVASFEEEFAAYSGARFAVAVNSGTSALQLALMAAGIGPGDEVITVAFTFVATVATIGYVGARAMLVDIDPRTFTMDVAQIERAITPRTKAIVPVHLYGQTADMNPIREIAQRHGLAVIEDAAQAHGAEYDGRRAGSIGDLACFSFYPAKNLGACGEGGLVTTSNPEYADAIRTLRDWGQESKSYYVRKGFNYRMDAVQGAILRVKLRHLDAWNDARRDLAAQYDALLRGSDVLVPSVETCNRHVYHVYAVRSANRDSLQRALARRGIETGIHYQTPVHLQPAYADLGYRSGDFPASERAAREVLSLPLYPELGRDKLELVVAAVRAS